MTKKSKSKKCDDVNALVLKTSSLFTHTALVGFFFDTLYAQNSINDANKSNRVWSLVNGIIHFLLLFLLWHIYSQRWIFFSYFAVMHWKGNFLNFSFVQVIMTDSLCLYLYIISYSILLCRQKTENRGRRQVPQAQGLLPKEKNWPTSSTTVNEPPRLTTIHTGYPYFASATDQSQIFPHKHRIESLIPWKLTTKW